MDAGMITEWREKKRMKEEEMSEKQSLNAGGIDVQMKGGGEWEEKGAKERKERRDRKQQQRKDQTFSVAAENLRKHQQRCCCRRYCCCCCCQGHFTETPLHSSGPPDPVLTSQTRIGCQRARGSTSRGWRHTFNWKILAVLAATRLGPDPAVPATLRENRS